MVNFILFVLFCCVVGAGGYFIFHLAAEQRRANDAKKKEEQQQSLNFRQVLLRGLREPGFDYASLLNQTGYPTDKAREIADEVYARVYERAVSDGKINDIEQRSLDKLAAALMFDSRRRAELESMAKQAKYRETLGRSLGDGDLTTSELQELRQLRASLGLTTKDLAEASGAIAQQVYIAQFRRIARSGTITQSNVEELTQLRQSIGITDLQGYGLIQKDALNLYHQRFCEIKQDGRITPEEEAELACLQRYLSIPAVEVEAVRHEIERVKLLDRIVRGDIPQISTSKLLEGGELCHLDSRCRHEFETRTKKLGVDGELTVTNQRIIFSSPTKSFEFRAAKVIDIQRYSDGVSLQTSGAKGSGKYIVQDSILAAAILEGVVRKHKYLAAESFSSTMSRHIPDLVKQEVWARDAGKCVKCDATDYLEFDHIIPHTKGGASSTNNVQLLCRRCNSIKSARIG